MRHVGGHGDCYIIVMVTRDKYKVIFGHQKARRPYKRPVNGGNLVLNGIERRVAATIQP